MAPLAASILPSGSKPRSATGAVIKRRKKPSARKLLQLPTQPHERLTTILARLGRPAPAYTIFEHKRFRAQLTSGPPSRPKQPHVTVSWDENEEDADGQWFSSASEAKRHAAEAACPELEKELRDAVLEVQFGGGDSSEADEDRTPAGGAANEREGGEKYAYHSLTPEGEEADEDMWLDFD